MTRRASIVASLWIVAGCGSEPAVRDPMPRPPTELQVSVVLTYRHELAVAPRRFGAGPVAITATNHAARTVRFAIAGGGAESLQPGEVGTLHADLAPGRHRLLAVSGSLRRAVTMIVGPFRPSPQNRLDLP
jgi:hypothetical protein